MQIIIWTVPNSEHCDRAKSYLAFKGLPYEERVIGDGWTKEDFARDVPHTTVLPQIVIDGVLVGSLTAVMQKFL